jgi:hypothetical protein
MAQSVHPQLRKFPRVPALTLRAKTGPIPAPPQRPANWGLDAVMSRRGARLGFRNGRLEAITSSL